MQSNITKIILPLVLLTPQHLKGEETIQTEEFNSSDSILSETSIPTLPIPSKNTKKPTKIGDFSFTDLKGNSHDFSKFKGKWVIVNYWATYCPPCRVEVTDLDMFARDKKSTAVVLGFDAGGNPTQELEQFKQEHELSYTMAPAQDSTLTSFGVIDALPTTFIVSPEGEIIDKHIGMITYDDLAYYTSPKDTKGVQIKK